MNNIIFAMYNTIFRMLLLIDDFRFPSDLEYIVYVYVLLVIDINMDKKSYLVS